MISLQEAVEIAKKRNPKFDTCQEYADAYVFYVDDGVVYYGGAEHNCIVEKSTGKTIWWSNYFMDGNRNVVEIGEPKKI